MTPLLLGGGVRGGGEKYGRNLFKIGRTLLIHPTPTPSPYRGGEYCGKSALLTGAGSRQPWGSLLLIPSSWEEGLGVEEKNTVATYSKSVEPY